MTFWFTGRNAQRGQPGRLVDGFSVQAADRFAAFDAARAARPDLTDIGLLRGDGLCPGCNGDGMLTDDPQVLQCKSCGGVYTANQHEPITREQAAKFVNLTAPMILGGEPRFAIDMFYFDLDLVAADPRASGNPSRLHGWADRRTKRVVQWG